MTTSTDIRVLIVDDSAVIRTLIADSVAAAPGMKVVGTAGDGAQALELLERVQPDVITLDVQMPRMDGLATLDAVLARRPVPVIMVSSLTKRGASITFDALDHGAVDYLAKPDYGAGTTAVLRDELPRKIRAVAGLDVRQIVHIRRKRQQRPRCATDARPKPAPLKAAPAVRRQLADKCVVIGISTGGPPALTQLFETLQPPMPPIVVVQHMPPSFTKPLAWRLDALSPLVIREAADRDALQPDHVLIAPGGKHLEVRQLGASFQAVVEDGAPVSGHIPSADVLMRSAAKTFGVNCLGIIMTGMGRDGADGCRAIRAAGGYVLGQDADSSAVYGMNKVAFNEGQVDRQFSLDDAAAAITHYVRSRFISAVAG